MKRGKVKFEYFQVRTANDGEVCEECKKHHMRIYPIILMDGLVPNHECTSEGGCRCYYNPTTRSEFNKQQEETRMGGIMTELKEKIAQAESLLREGQKVQARNLLVEVVNADAQNVQAWYLLSFVADDTDQALYCIRQAAKAAPQNTQVQQRLSALEGRPAVIPGYQPTAAPTSAPRAAAPESVPFYREPLFKGFAFLVLTPVWVLIMLTDKRETATMKMIAVAVQVIYCFAAFWIAIRIYFNWVS